MEPSLDTAGVVYRRALGRAAGAMVAIAAMIASLVVLAAPAYAASYGVSVYTSPSSTSTGNSISWVATNDSSTSAWVVLCTSWNGSPVAQSHLGPGQSFSHPITKYSATSETLVALVPYESNCHTGYDSTATGTWTSSYSAPTTTVPRTTTTTRPPAQTYSVVASASPTSLSIDHAATIYGRDNGNGKEHISLCTSYGVAPTAEGVHSPGGELSHSVTESAAGAKTFYLFAGPSYSCSGPHSTVTVTWRNAPTITANPTNAGTSQPDYPNKTTLAWDDAKPGDAVRVALTDDNGAKTYKVIQTTPVDTYSGSGVFDAKQYAPQGTQWVNDYKAELISSSGSVLSWEAFTFTWNGTACVNDTLGFSANSAGTGLVGSMSQGECIPAGTNTFVLYWESTNPSPGKIQPSLAYEVGSYTIGTGPKNIPYPGVQHTFYPSGIHAHGYFEMYLVTSKGNAIVACTGIIHLGVKATNHYAVSIGASDYSPTVGTPITLTLANTSTTNSEWVSYCGQSGTTLDASGSRGVGDSLSTKVTSASAGKVTYYARGYGSEKCAGASASTVVDWQAAPKSASPALIVTATNLAPTLGGTDTIVLESTSSLSSEWLDYCGVSGSHLGAAGTRSPGGEVITTVSSPASPGEVTYHGRATIAEGCTGGATSSVTVDWQAPPTTTTTTTTTPPSYSGGGATTTTTVPSYSGGTTTTTTPPSYSGGGATTTTTVPPATATTTVPPVPTTVTWYPT